MGVHAVELLMARRSGADHPSSLITRSRVVLGLLPSRVLSPHTVSSYTVPLVDPVLALPLQSL